MGASAALPAAREGPVSYHKTTLILAVPVVNPIVLAPATGHGNALCTTCADYGPAVVANTSVRFSVFPEFVWTKRGVNRLPAAANPW